MKCPVDQTELMRSDRHGINVDYCPNCRGVWLDRGELAKIIDATVPPLVEAEPAPETREDREPYRHGDAKVWREPDHGESSRIWREPYRHARPYTKEPGAGLLKEIFNLD